MSSIKESLKSYMLELQEIKYNFNKKFVEIQTTNDLIQVLMDKYDEVQASTTMTDIEKFQFIIDLKKMITNHATSVKESTDKVRISCEKVLEIARIHSKDYTYAYQINELMNRIVMATTPIVMETLEFIDKDIKKYKHLA